MKDKVFFLSDLHLGADYLPDKAASERRVVDFLMQIKDEAADVYLMGDILDYWFEYRTVVPRGFVRFFGALAALADSGTRVHWFIGNHDIWLFDYLRSEIGMEVVDGSSVREIMGRRFFLAHGDGVGRRPASFRLLRSVFRNKACQWLYSMLPPAWTVRFAHWWSANSRSFDQQRAAPPFKGLDDEPQAVFAVEYLRDIDPAINFFVMGHCHAAADVPLSPSCRLVLLGDWITQCTYAVFDGNSLQLKKYTP